jgi:hypothetical protein
VLQVSFPLESEGATTAPREGDLQTGACPLYMRAWSAM